MYRLAFICVLFVLSFALPGAAGAGLRDNPIVGDSIKYLDGAWTLTNGGQTTIPGKVPGDLITDLYSAGLVGDPLTNENWLNSTLWNASDWTYTTTFQLPEITASTRDVLLVFDGVKMGALVTLNGNPIGTVVDQFLRYSYSVLPYLRKSPAINTLSVVFPRGAGPDVQGRFMACTGGWDWAPYSNTYDQHGAFTLSKGIWKSVYLVFVSSVAITDVVPQITYTGPYPRAPLTDHNHAPFSVALTVHLRTPLAARGRMQVTTDWGDVHTEVVNVASGRSTYNVTLTTDSRRVKLWWPNGLGEQNLYNVSVSFQPDSRTATVSTSRRVGFRVFALVTTNDTDETTDGDGSGTFTMRFRVNGANFFARGANMIPMEEYEGRANAEAFRLLVHSARDAHMNILRIWGGGIFYYDVFYDTCDELGLVLYHDMMYAQQGHSPLATSTQQQELQHQIRRLSHHPSIVIWDGCNECGGLGIYTDFVMTVVSQEDQSRAVWPSCPSPGWDSGVDTLYGRPDGKKLVPRKDNGVHEQHGPYKHGSGWPAVNGDAKIRMFSPNLPPFLSSPSQIGVQYPGYFVSEFGCVGWSSFESTTATLSPQYWSLHAKPMYQRNYPCDNIIEVYWGTQNLNLTGASPFKRQLYQCLIGQVLELKSEIEYLRSTNTFGTVIWQLNEIWPTGGWGSVEYGTPVAGQVLGGRWKPLHYVLKDTLFPDVTATCGNESFCIIRNDAPHPFSGTVDLDLVHFQTGKVATVSSRKVQLAGSTNAQWFCVQDRGDDSPASDLNCVPWAQVFNNYGCTNGGNDCIMIVTVTSESGTVVSENVLALSTPASMNLPATTVTFTTSQNSEGGADIILSTNNVAAYTVLTTQAAGRFSENAMLLLPGKKTIKFFPFGQLNLSLLSSTLRVEHAQQYR